MESELKRVGGKFIQEALPDEPIIRLDNQDPLI